MALTNAQLQARHRERVKARLTLAALVENFRQTVRHQIAEAGGDPDCSDVVAEHVGRLMHTPEGAETIRPFLAQALGIQGMPVATNADDVKVELAA